MFGESAQDDSATENGDNIMNEKPKTERHLHQRTNQDLFGATTSNFTQDDSATAYGHDFMNKKPKTERQVYQLTA